MKMNQFSEQYIRKFNKQQNFPSAIVDQDCLIYKELIFDENLILKGASVKNLSQSFIIENANKEDENKPFQNRGWKGNENNRKTLSKKKIKIKINELNFLRTIFN